MIAFILYDLFLISFGESNFLLKTEQWIFSL